MRAGWIEYCQARGISHGAVIRAESLPDSVFLEPRPDGGSYAVLAAAGGEFWRHIDTSVDDPIDTAAAELGRWVVGDNLDVELLYPGPCPLGLQRLLAFLGWVSDAGPLGMLMHGEHGSFFAMRCIMYTRHPLPSIQFGDASTHSPCVTCAAPCVDACPGEALALGAMPILERCGKYRARTDSRCRSTCVAREACPAGGDPYDRAQLHHHYTAADWFKQYV